MISKQAALGDSKRHTSSLIGGQEIFYLAYKLGEWKRDKKLIANFSTDYFVSVRKECDEAYAYC